jgi:hypothetical protein
MTVSIGEGAMSKRRGLTGMLCAAVIAVAGCQPATPAPTESVPTGPSASSPLRSNPADASPAPSAPPSSVADRPLGWIPLGSVGDANSVSELLSFDGGYVVTGGVGDNLDLRVWTSRDGAAWSVADLGERRSCGGIFPYVERAASSGRAVLLVGLEADDASARCSGRVVSWVTSDGRTWRRGFEASRVVGRNVVGVWASPDGWEAVLAEETGRHTLWRSPDGLSWSEDGVVEPLAELSPMGASAIDPAGVRLMSMTWGDVDPPSSSLLVSTDGRAWRQLDRPKLDGRVVARLVPPTTARPFWLVVASDTNLDVPTSATWVSSDLRSWKTAPLPLGTADGIASTSRGILALAEDVCQVTGSPCGQELRPARYLLTQDGLNWTTLPAAVGPTSFVDGPAGIVGIDQGGATWKLDTFSDDESYLLEGIRADARSGCSPRRDDLPRGAVAGVECRPGGDLVEQVGAYLFSSDGEALDAYFERLAEAGIAPRTGNCPASAGEAAYQPEAEGDLGPARMGCFVNEFGNANLRSTVPEAHVYVGILGRARDIAKLWAWAWEGNQDQPGSPTIWRGASRG